MSAKIDLRDKRFGKLVVVGVDGAASSGGLRWLCRCDCGREKSILGDSLRKKNGTRSCGCLVAERTREVFEERRRISGAYGSGFRRLYNRYRFRAKYEKLPFCLSEEVVATISRRSCHYCGALPAQIMEPDGTPWIYNGLDRVDNARGYVPENVVSCCRVCNEMKLDRSVNDFLKHVRAIVAHTSRPQSLE